MSSEPSSATTPSLTQDALLYITTLVRDCQQRGGYTLDEAVALHRALANVSSAPCSSSSAIHVLFQLLNKSQSLGKLSLKEAWTVYNAQEVLLVSTEKARGEKEEGDTTIVNDTNDANNAETVNT